MDLSILYLLRPESSASTFRPVPSCLPQIVRSRDKWSITGQLSRDRLASKLPEPIFRGKNRSRGRHPGHDMILMDSILGHVRRIVSTYIDPCATELKTTWIGITIPVFVILSSGLSKASYGRHFRENARIPTVNGKVGWMVQEAFAPLAAFTMFNAYKSSGQGFSKGGFLMASYLLHYSNRAFLSVLLSPHMNSTRVDIVLMATLFNMVNGGWLGHDLGELNSEPLIISLRTLVGFVLFIAGGITNITCDYYIQSMRRKKQNRGEYILPDWGFYKYIVSPNYAAEMVEWTGYALMMRRQSGWVFLLWTISNLAPRARANLNWYREKFGDKVGSRKALIPGAY